jgi:hypothetical protein
MARYHHLTIYRDLYQFLLELNRCTLNFSKNFKYTSGQTLLELSIKRLSLIVQISSEKKMRSKQIYLKRFILMSHESEVRLRLLRDLNVISKEVYASLILKESKIVKQAQGWLNKTKENFLEEKLQSSQSPNSQD